MFKVQWNKKNTTEAIYACAVLAIALTGIAVIVNIGFIYHAVLGFFRVISPIVYGLALAYIINPLLKLLETKVFGNIKTKKIIWSPRIKRTVSLIVSYLVLGLFLFLIGLLIFPQIVGKYDEIIGNLSTYLQDTAVRFADTFGFDSEQMTEQIETYKVEFLSYLGALGGQATLWLLTFLLGFFLSFFVLLHKEHLIAATKKFLASFLKPKRFNSVMSVTRLTDRTFGKFFVGKIFDSLIIGIISIVTFWAFRMPYAPLLAAIVCITNIIPYFGPIFGAIPCVILVLTESPMKAFWIAVMILVIQQIDGNIIGPKILGNVIGISSLWVVISITIMGSFFGFVGMVIGVPLFSVLYTIVKEHTEKRLAKRNLPTETKAYADVSPLAVIEESVNLPPERFLDSVHEKVGETKADETTEVPEEVDANETAEPESSEPDKVPETVESSDPTEAGAEQSETAPDPDECAVDPIDEEADK